MEWFIAHLSLMTPAGAYLSLTGVLLLCGLGLPIPEDLSLIAAGYFSYKGVLFIHKAFLVCFAAVLVGDTTAFVMGRWFGRRFLATSLAQRTFTPRRQRRVRAYFRKYGSKVVILARFTPGFRFSIFFSAGMLHVRPSIFFVYDFLAASVSVPVLVYMAWMFGGQIDRVISAARRTEHGILVAVGVLAVVIGVRAWRRHHRRLRLAESGCQPPETVERPPATDAGRLPDEASGNPGADPVHGREPPQQSETHEPDRGPKAIGRGRRML